MVDTIEAIRRIEGRADTEDDAHCLIITVIITITVPYRQ